MSTRKSKHHSCIKRLRIKDSTVTREVQRWYTSGSWATTRSGGIEQTSITFIVLPLGQVEQVHKQATLRASPRVLVPTATMYVVDYWWCGIKRLLMGNKCRIHTTGPDTVKSMRRVLYVNVPYPLRRRCSTAQTLDGEYRFKAWAAAVNCRYGRAIDYCCHLRSDAPGLRLENCVGGCLILMLINLESVSISRCDLMNQTLRRCYDAQLLKLKRSQKIHYQIVLENPTLNTLFQFFLYSGFIGYKGTPM